MSVELKSLNPDPRYLYQDDDCNLYIKAAIIEELEGFAPNKTYRLNKTFKENGKDRHVLVTPPVNGQAGIPKHTLGIDAFLRKHPSALILILEALIKDQGENLNIEEDVITIENNAHGGDDKVGASVLDILQKNQYKKSKIEEYIRKEKAQHVDVFDEIEEIWEDGKEQEFVIYFPITLGRYPPDHQFTGGSHWQLGEIQIHKKQDGSCSIDIFAHDPFGGGKMSDENYNKIYDAIDDRLPKPHGMLTFEQGIESPYNRRQTGGTECGVIVCDDLIKRVTGKTLDVNQPYPNGAPELRKKQAETVEKYNKNIALQSKSPQKNAQEPPKIIIPNKASSTSTLKRTNPKWENFSDNVKTQDVLKKALQNKSDTQEVTIEKGKATITDKNGKIDLTSKNGIFEISTKDEKMFKSMVDNSAALFAALEFEEPKPEIEVEAPNQRQRKMLVDLCEAAGLKVKKPPLQQQTENNSEENLPKAKL